MQNQEPTRKQWIIELKLIPFMWLDSWCYSSIFVAWYYLCICNLFEFIISDVVILVTESRWRYTFKCFKLHWLSHKSFCRSHLLTGPWFRRCPSSICADALLFCKVFFLLKDTRYTEMYMEQSCDAVCLDKRRNDQNMVVT